MQQDQSYAAQRRGILAWFARHPIITCVCIFLLLLAFAVFAFDRRAEHILARKIAAIRARGEPTTIKDLLARRKNIPDDENMSVAFVAAAGKIKGLKLDDERLKLIPYEGTATVGPTGQRWTDAQIRASRQYLSENDVPLRELHAAMMRPKSEYFVNWSTPAIAVLLPDLSTVRQGGKVLVLEIQVAAQSRDAAGFRRSLSGVMPTTHAMEGNATLIGALVQLAINNLIEDSIERSINFGGVDDDTLQKLPACLKEAEFCPNMKFAFQAERVLLLDTLQWMRSKTAPSGVTTGMFGPAAPSPLSNTWRYLPAIPAMDIADGLTRLDDLVNAVDQPDGKSIERIKALDASCNSFPWYNVASRMLIPSLSQCVVLWVRYVGQNRALRAAIAAERFRLATGHWPDSLQTLVPMYLDAVPLDPIDDKPIRYAIIPEGIKTWTISDDDKNEDNGGDVKRLEKWKSSDRPKDYGWVILNPPLRNRPAPTEGSTTRPTTAPTASTSRPAA